MLIAFNKPFGTICQFTPSGGKPTLAAHIRVPNVYPAGRLDTDSEGLLLLTDEGPLQAYISNPKARLTKTYWAQVEGDISAEALAAFAEPLDLGDFNTRPTKARMIEPPNLWSRTPPIRVRAAIPTSWCEIELTEGKNRQVRRMTAKIGFPTLRLVRARVGWCDLALLGLAPGEWKLITPDTVFKRPPPPPEKPL